MRIDKIGFGDSISRMLEAMNRDQMCGAQVRRKNED
jgi:hypothetical protein